MHIYHRSGGLAKMVQLPKSGIKVTQIGDGESQIKFRLYKLGGEVYGYYCVDIAPFIVTDGVVPKESGYCYQVLVLSAVEKICGSQGDLQIPGWVLEVAKSQGSLTGMIYRFKSLSGDEYDSLGIPCQQNHSAVYAFARGLLADGKFNLAKYALYSTGNVTLWEHSQVKALSKTGLRVLAYDLEQILFHPEKLVNHEIGIPCANIRDKSAVSVVEVMEFLSQHRQHILLNQQQLQTNYERTGIKQVYGLLKSGEKTWLKTEYIDYSPSHPYVRMGKVVYNHHSATMNLLIQRRVRLLKQEDNTPVTDVAGAFLDNLNQFNSYTIVRDGQLNISSLCIKIGNKAVFDWLRRYNLIAASADFDFEREYTVFLGDLPLVNFDSQYTIPDGLLTQILVAKVLMGMIKACLKNESIKWIPRQTEQLRNHYLSPNLYVNFPHQPEQHPLSGLVTGNTAIRQRYRIELGNSMILHLGQLKSANQFFHQYYDVYDQETGEIFANGNMSMLWSENIQFESKKLTKRRKITAIDLFVKSIFDEFLGLASLHIIKTEFARMGMGSLIHTFPVQYHGDSRKKAETVAALTTAYTHLQEYIERTYRELISPLIFYIGATGVLPDSLSDVMGQQVMDGEELIIKYPNLKISRDESDGLFFEVGNHILSIYPQTTYYSRNSQ